MTGADRLVAGYLIREQIGTGGAATVYTARQVGLRRDVALKELRDLDPLAADRFLQEAEALATLNHPNIVTVFDYFEYEGRQYIAMEYLPRGSLRPFLGRLELGQALAVLRDTLAGLGHAHERGLVHRDIKPENLMVADDGRIKIADFGIVKALGSDRHLTETRSTVGSRLYMAPEQAMGHPIAITTDLYAVGLLGYEMLCGRLPYDDAETPEAMLVRRVNEPAPPLIEENPALDPGLGRWVDRMLEQDPAHRIQDTKGAGEWLTAIATDLLGPDWPPTTIPAGPPTSLQHVPWQKLGARSKRPAAPPAIPLDTRSIVIARPGTVTRSDHRKALAINAATKPVNVIVGAGVLLAALLLDQIWLVGVAAVAYATLVVVTLSDSRESNRVRAGVRNQRMLTVDPNQLDPLLGAPLASAITEGDAVKQLVSQQSLPVDREPLLAAFDREVADIAARAHAAQSALSEARSRLAEVEQQIDRQRQTHGYDDLVRVLGEDRTRYRAELSRIDREAAALDARVIELRRAHAFLRRLASATATQHDAHHEPISTGDLDAILEGLREAFSDDLDESDPPQP